MVSFFPLLSLSEPEGVDEHFLLVADNEEEDIDEDEETAAAPPCRFVLVAFLAALGEPPRCGWERSI